MPWLERAKRVAPNDIETRLILADAHWAAEDEEALQAYGEAALALGQVEDALKIYLRLIVAKSEDRRIRELLSSTLKAPGGLEFLNEHLPASKSSASALAFLASTIKDHSGIKEAITLYDACLTHAPDNASYAL